MTIELLLLAAEFIDKRERASEHGYACIATTTRPRTRHSSAGHYRTSSSSSSSSSSLSPLFSASSRRYRLKRASANSSSLGANRSAHNELEKNRRAHMRLCMDQLKKVVPLGSDSSKHTTLGLLTKARRLIKCLQDEYCANSRVLLLERKTERRLRRQLRHGPEEEAETVRYWSTGSDVGSESSSSSSSTSPLTVISCSTALETEPIDVVGYGKKASSSLMHRRCSSDGDDHSQGSYDSGCIVSPRLRLTMDGL